MLTAEQVEVWYRPLRDGYAFRLWSHALDGVPAETVRPLLERLLRKVLGICRLCASSPRWKRAAAGRIRRR